MSRLVINPYRVGFSPADIPGLSLWMDAATLSLADGAAVSSWIDRVAAYDFIQATETNRPIYRSAGIGTSPAVEFDGSNDLLVCTSFDPTWGNFTAFAVFKPDANASGTRRVFDLAYDTSFWIGKRGTYADQWGGGCRQTSGIYGTFVTTSSTSAQVIAQRRSGTTQTIRANGGANTATATVSSSALSSVQATIGSSSADAAGDRVDARIAEIVLFSAAITDAQCEAVENYLGAKYGIVVTH